MYAGLPEPWRSLIRAGKAAEAADLEVRGALEQFARAIARMLVGRDGDARSDLEACEPELGDVCRIELAFLATRGGGSLEDVGAEAKRCAECAPPGSAHHARSLHILGLVEGKLRRHAAATDALAKAAAAYRKLQDWFGFAQVQDTFGMLFAAKGQLERAASYYAISLVHKTRVDDRWGIAITLGNLGRLHLRAGRFRDALDCFELDLAAAAELGDDRATARMLNDIGRTLVGLGEYAAAVDSLQACLALARAKRFAGMEANAHKDLALARLAQGKIDEVSAHIDAAEALADPAADPLLGPRLDVVRGRWHLARKELAKAEFLIRGAAEAFAESTLPDEEIPALLALAEVLVAQGKAARAYVHLRRASRLAHADGYARYLPRIREEMARLALVMPAHAEQGRLSDTVDAGPPRSDQYIIFERLGCGAFGEVYRAFDPERGIEVALKRLSLERLYDVERRRLLLASLRTELYAASGLLHPGVARVYAIGIDTGGGTYVAQQFIEGKSLREWMRAEGGTPTPAMLRLVENVAHALQELHDHGVIHRDLKPENVMVRADGTPVLIDFGIARVPDRADAFLEETIAGTIEYMAPEQAAGKSARASADLYSLGVILFEWLTGSRPLSSPRTDLHSVIRHIQEAPVPSVATQRAGLWPELVAMVDQLLAKDPVTRPTTQEVAKLCHALAAR